MRRFQMTRKTLGSIGEVLEVVGGDPIPEIIDETTGDEASEVIQIRTDAQGVDVISIATIPETVEILETSPLPVSEDEADRLATAASAPTTAISPSEIAETFSKETIETIIQKTQAHIEDIANTAIIIFERVFQAEFNTIFEVVSSPRRARDAYSGVINVESLINSDMLMNQFSRDGDSVSDSIYMLRLNNDLEEVDLKGLSIYCLSLTDENIEYIDLDSSNAFSVTTLAMSDSILLALGLTVAGNNNLEDLLEGYNPSGEAEKTIYTLGSATSTILKPTTIGQGIISQIIEKCVKLFVQNISNTDAIKSLLVTLADAINKKTAPDDLAYVKVDAVFGVSKSVLPEDLEVLDIVLSHDGTSADIQSLSEDLPGLIVESLQSSIGASVKTALELDMVDMAGAFVEFYDIVTEFNKTLNGIVLMYLLEDDKLKASVTTILEVLEDITISAPEIFVRFDGINEYFSAVAELMANPTEFIEASYNEKWYYRPVTQLIQSKFDEVTAFKYRAGDLTEEIAYKILSKDDFYLIDSLLLALGDGFNQGVEFVVAQCERVSSNISVLCDETQIIIDTLKGISKVEAANIDALQIAKANVLENSAGLKESLLSYSHLVGATSDSFKKLNNKFDTGIVVTSPSDRADEHSQELSGYSLSPMTKGVIGLSALALLYAGIKKVVK